MMLKYTVIFIFLVNSLFSQHTVGLFLNLEESCEGYTMFAPLRSVNTYLIDECGEKVHSWGGSSYFPGNSAYILENGLLLRTGKTTNQTFNAGGLGGAIEIIDWNSNIIWDYVLSNTLECLHHDVEYLPNGNILAISWDLKTNTEAINAGRGSCGAVLWSEKIIEIQPDYLNNTATIVWEWKVWDHLVQDIDNTKNNFGNTSNPELININHYDGNPIDKDWLHINSIDYNEKLDQIILSVHNFNEVWIIDHSTTISESAIDTGGIYSKGGNLLYRWGNPATYNKGDSNDKKLFSQHDAYWIEDSLIDAGKIMIFNNNAGSPTPNSAVNIIDLPIDTNGNYTYSDSAYLPINFHWTYQAENPTDFYGQNISGAQRLTNGNTLICEGPTGRIFEVDYLGIKVWEYMNPVSYSGILQQGDPATQNRAFRAYRYSTNYSGFDGKTLTPQGYIETNSIFTCDMFTNIKEEKEVLVEFNIYPNPSNGVFIITHNYKTVNIEITDITGKYMYKGKNIINNFEINIRDFKSGIYFMRLTNKKNSIVKKIILKR